MNRLFPVAILSLAFVADVAWAQGQPPQPRRTPGQRQGQGVAQPGERGPGQGQRQGPGGGQRGMGGPGGGMRGGLGGGFGGGMFGGGNPTISSADFARYAQRLNLNDDQQAAAKSLLEGYRAEIKSIDDAVNAKRQEAMEKFRENRDPAAFDSVRTAGDEANKQKAKVETGFFEDVKSLLSKEQESKWDGVERMHRRDVGLRVGRLSGERMDVTRLVDELKLDDKALSGLADTLESYESQLDRELAARKKIYDEVQGKIPELMRNQDMDAAQKELDRAREAGLKVREINKKFARQIIDALPDNAKPVMALAVKKASHPDVYRDTPVAQQLAAAEKLTTLDDTQKKAITELKDRSTREINGINDKIAAAAEEVELTVSAADIVGRFRGGQPGPADDLRQQRRDLEDAASESLKKILTPAQLDQLPKPQGGRGRRGPQPQDENNDDSN